MHAASWLARLGMVALAMAAARGAAASWVLFSPSVPNASPGNTANVERAFGFAPSDSMYSLWRAEVTHSAWRSQWLRSSAAELGARAEVDARHAAAANHANPFAHAHLGRVLLDRARRPETSANERTRLLREATGAFDDAVQQWPLGPSVAANAASALARVWSILDEEAQSRLSAYIGQTAHNYWTFPRLVSRVVLALRAQGSVAGEVIAVIESAAPHEARAQSDIARVFQRQVGRNTRADSEYARAAVRALGAAYVAAPTDSGALQTWQRTWTQYFPDEVEARRGALEEVLDGLDSLPLDTEEQAQRIQELRALGNRLLQGSEVP